MLKRGGIAGSASIGNQAAASISSAWQPISPWCWSG
jgi:hypothetical protein